jgi:hypothetical protein
VNVDGGRSRVIGARGALALVMSIVCAASVVLATPALAARETVTEPPKPNPGKAVKGVKSTKYGFIDTPDDAKALHKARSTKLPEAASASLALADGAGKALGKTKAGRTPVWARAVAGTADYTGPRRRPFRCSTRRWHRTPVWPVSCSRSSHRAAPRARSR